jgi:hypothetical protein
VGGLVTKLTRVFCRETHTLCGVPLKVYLGSMFEVGGLGDLSHGFLYVRQVGRGIVVGDVHAQTRDQIASGQPEPWQ